MEYDDRGKVIFFRQKFCTFVQKYVSHKSKQLLTQNTAFSPELATSGT